MKQNLFWKMRYWMKKSMFRCLIAIWCEIIKRTINEHVLWHFYRDVMQIQYVDREKNRSIIIIERKNETHWQQLYRNQINNRSQINQFCKSLFLYNYLIFLDFNCRVFVWEKMSVRLFFYFFYTRKKNTKVDS